MADDQKEFSGFGRLTALLAALAAVLAGLVVVVNNYKQLRQAVFGLSSPSPSPSLGVTGTNGTLDVSAQVNARTPWQNTGILLHKGERVSFIYLSGTWTISTTGNYPQVDAEGWDWYSILSKDPTVCRPCFIDPASPRELFSDASTPPDKFSKLAISFQTIPFKLLVFYT